ncbi:MAG: VWA domain-containing protein [Candidatus Obscuribacterales bacterium]|nr:VWA domain-containing protein [Candidatus Obscuribacterales bacterium]
MPYTAEISRANPSCIVILIDQSGSMEDQFGQGTAGKRKADGVADAVNRLLQNLVIKCAKSEGIRDYYHVGVLGYGDKGVGSAFTGPLANRELVPISEIANSPARVEQRTKKVDDGAGGIIEQKIKFPIWIDPVYKGGTPMCEALRQSKRLVTEWIRKNVGCFPPIVINITDGEATDGNAEFVAEEIKRLSSEDGHVLLFNLHISSSNHAAVEFPDDQSMLPDDYARLLFRMSSPLPDYMWTMVQEEGIIICEHPKGFVFNADLVSVIRFLSIGTRPSNLR